VKRIYPAVSWAKWFRYRVNNKRLIAAIRRKYPDNTPAPQRGVKENER
jgi:hypothetical protein